MSVASLSLSQKTARVKKASEQRQKHAQRAAVYLKHASDATRLQVLLILAEGEKHVGALCEELGLDQPPVSHHLALMRHGGIVVPRRQGQNTFYGLTESGEELARVAATLMV